MSSTSTTREVQFSGNRIIYFLTIENWQNEYFHLIFQIIFILILLYYVMFHVDHHVSYYD